MAKIFIISLLLLLDAVYNFSLVHCLRFLTMQLTAVGLVYYHVDIPPTLVYTSVPFLCPGGTSLFLTNWQCLDFLGNSLKRELKFAKYTFSPELTLSLHKLSICVKTVRAILF